MIKRFLLTTIWMSTWLLHSIAIADTVTENSAELNRYSTEGCAFAGIFAGNLTPQFFPAVLYPGLGENDFEAFVNFDATLFIKPSWLNLQSPNTIKIVEPGPYKVTWRLFYTNAQEQSSSEWTNALFSLLAVNGNAVSSTVQPQLSPKQTLPIEVTGSTVLSLNAGDQLSLLLHARTGFSNTQNIGYISNSILLIKQNSAGCD